MSHSLTEDDNDLLNRLNERLSQARERLRFAEAEATRLRRHIQALQEVVATIAPGASIAQELLIKDAFIRELPAVKRPFAKMSVKDAVLILLTQRGEPMAVRELYEALRQGGKHVGGVRPTDTLRSLLRSYEEVFARTPDHKWRIANGAHVDTESEPELAPPQPVESVDEDVPF